MSRRDGRLGVGAIGPGRLGPVLLAALAGAGHAVIGVEAANDDARERVDALLPGVPVLSRAAIVERSELVIVDAIGVGSRDRDARGADREADLLIDELSRAGAWVAGQIVWCTAPDGGAAVREGAFDRGVIPIAVHPAIDPTGTSLDLARLREAWCAVSSSAAFLPIAQALVVELGAEPVVVDGANRAAYAAALAAATEPVRRAVADATATLAGLGVESPGFLLSSLVRSAVDNALADGGPAPLS